MTNNSIFHQFKKTVYLNPTKILFEDVLGQKLKAWTLYFKSLFLGEILKHRLKQKRTIGLCLPNTATFPIVFLALQSKGYIPAILNYKSGSTSIKNSAYTAGVSKIITSRLFEEKAELTATFNELKEQNLEFIYLEDILKNIKLPNKIIYLIKALLSEVYIPKETEPAVILFTSGSEGTPKGVVLSHINLIENVNQATRRIPLTHDDIFFSSLPFFHSFGLLAGVLLPIFYGLKSYIYPSPLDYKKIPQKIEESKATVLFSANTFLQGYASSAEPNMLKSLRFIIAGAEKLYDQTRDLYKNKFGVHIYEGYGVTETSPVISFNVEELNRIGSVGKALDGIDTKIEPIEGYTEGGKLFVKGPNVMLGYYLASAPQVLVEPTDGWHDTGDIACIDDDGFIFIRGRAKRFAKIGGEMISLGAIEYHLSQTWPDHKYAVVSIRDPRKGEKVILLTTYESLSKEMLINSLKEGGFSKLYNPSSIIYQEGLPLLSTGKLDYVSIQEIAKFSEEKDIANSIAI